MIAVLDYGIGNLRSAQKALQRAGGDARLVTTPDAARGADAVVLPGVGAFGACMDALRASGLDAVVHDAVERELPFLGICIGLQMLYDGSEEAPATPGLGVLAGTVRRMTGGAKLPQMQWNRVQVRRSSPLLRGLGQGQDWCYFVHSYAAELTDDVVATCEYGGPVVAAVQRGNVFATQFHPEKSSTVGLSVLANFVELAT